MEVATHSDSMTGFIDGLSRAAAEILDPHTQTNDSSSPLIINTTGSHHHESLSLLSTLADLASTEAPASPSSDSELLYNQSIQSSSTKAPLHSNTNPNVIERRNLRPRALSESWVTEDSWKKNIQIAQSSAAIADTTGIVLPYMLEKYSSIYNRNGRIGVYSREERDVIIQRFHDKRRRRMWKKNIRYHCRKNLADRRVRIKGRFVRAESIGSQAELTTNTTTSTSTSQSSSSSNQSTKSVKTEPSYTLPSSRLPSSLAISSTSSSSSSSSALISSTKGLALHISSTKGSVTLTAGSEPPSSTMEELLAAAALQDPDSLMNDQNTEEHRPISSIGLQLLEQAIQFDDEDSRLPPGKRMRRHTIV